ncbi:MAG: hypothetical protein OEX12_05835 [Gammaproteobacteria bacterium]|nr:hypothetical protein [Gammaproteobacteria bacterium]
MIKLYKILLWAWNWELRSSQRAEKEIQADIKKANERIKRYEEITNHCGHFKIPEER